MNKNLSKVLKIYMFFLKKSDSLPLASFSIMILVFGNLINIWIINRELKTIDTSAIAFKKVVDALAKATFVEENNIINFEKEVCKIDKELQEKSKEDKMQIIFLDLEQSALSQDATHNKFELDLLCFINDKLEHVDFCNQSAERTKANLVFQKRLECLLLKKNKKV